MKRKPILNPKIHLAKAWAIVTPRGRILIDTVGFRDEVTEYYSDWHKERGYRIKRVTIVNHQP